MGLSLMFFLSMSGAVGVSAGLPTARAAGVVAVAAVVVVSELVPTSPVGEHGATPFRLMLISLQVLRGASRAGFDSLAYQ